MVHLFSQQMLKYFHQSEQRVVVRKLRNARAAYDMLMANCYYGQQVSSMPHEEQSDILAQLLAQAIPEYVAILCDGIWSASGTHFTRRHCVTQNGRV